MKSSKTQGGGEEEQWDLEGAMHNVLMSDQLRDVLDPQALHGNVEEDDTQDVTRKHVSSSSFTCGVTLLDEQVRSGRVVYFLRKGHEYTITSLYDTRAADDILTETITAVTVKSPSGAGVVDVEFDVEDPYDIPDIMMEPVTGGVTLTLSFTLPD